MNERHPMDVLHSFSIKNIFYDLSLYYFHMMICFYLLENNFVCFQSLCKRAIEVCSNAVSKRSTEKNATVQKDATKRERKNK